MRSLGNSKKTITATPRQLESMIRIAESLAKMRLSEVVEKQDVDEAVRLIKHAFATICNRPNDWRDQHGHNYNWTNKDFGREIGKNL
jgi:DNA replicative helicase MCM subunit Mcm2 (Cdc46/Mcm family)